MGPATKPPLRSQRSRRYCERARSGSAARTGTVDQTANAASRNAARQVRVLRQKRELLNHHLDSLRGGLPPAAIVEQCYLRSLGTRRRHARIEQPLGDNAGVL